MKGAGKDVIIFLPFACEPELMYAKYKIVVNLDELTEALTQA